MRTFQTFAAATPVTASANRSKKWSFFDPPMSVGFEPKDLIFRPMYARTPQAQDHGNKYIAYFRLDRARKRHSNQDGIAASA